MASEKLCLEVKNLLLTFFPIAWMGHLGLGLTYGLMGPAQPYLASQVGVGHQVISLLWSARAAGITLACITSGPGFSMNFMKNSSRKLIFLAASMILPSVSLFLVPFVKTFPLLMLLFGILTFGTGSFDVADNGLMNTMLGPETSRPLVQSLHACVAIGFVLVAFLMPQFLPTSSGESTKAICDRLKNPDINDTTTNLEEINLIGKSEEWPILAKPCVLIASWLFIVGLGFLILAMKDLKLPLHQKNNQLVSINDITNAQEFVIVENTGAASTNNEMPKYKIGVLICLGVIFYFLFCGIDSYFQSQTYTYGLCGPLELSSDTAGWLNTIYFGHYLIGRIISIPISTLIPPSVIISISILGCLLSTTILVSFGTYNTYALFIATGLMGLCICFLFPSGINWLSSNIPNLSSRQISIIFLGSNLANCIFPPLASKLFNEFGPIYVFYMTLIVLIITLICYLLMLAITRGFKVLNQSNKEFV